MKISGTNFLKAISVSALLVMASSSANAAHFMFSQAGFSGGGTITGGFDAVDDDHNGWIDTWNDPSVTNFHLSFSGDSLVGDFSANDLGRLTYKIGSGVIGIEFNEVDGLSSFIDTAGFHQTTPPYNQLYSFSTHSNGGSAVDFLRGTISSTTELMQVSEVPLPGAAGLFAFGLAGLFTKARKKVYQWSVVKRFEACF